MSVMVILQDVNSGEVEVGPFEQLVTEMEMVGQATSISVVDVASHDVVVHGAGGWWWHDGRPFKQLWVRGADEA